MILSGALGDHVFFFRLLPIGVATADHHSGSSPISPSLPYILLCQPVALHPQISPVV